MLVSKPDRWRKPAEKHPADPFSTLSRSKGPPYSFLCLSVILYLGSSKISTSISGQLVVASVLDSRLALLTVSEYHSVVK